MTESFTLLDNGAATRLDAQVDGATVLVDAAEVARATGWELKPEGLCREGICVPLRGASALRDGGRITLDGLATALQRPLALDAERSAAFLGAGAGARGEQLRGRQAPDFTLPDLSGRMHTLSRHRGKKVLLVAFASW